MTSEVWFLKNKKSEVSQEPVWKGALVKTSDLNLRPKRISETINRIAPQYPFLNFLSNSLFIPTGIISLKRQARKA